MNQEDIRQRKTIRHSICQNEHLLHLLLPTSTYCPQTVASIQSDRDSTYAQQECASPLHCFGYIVDEEFESLQIFREGVQGEQQCKMILLSSPAVED